MHMYAFTKCKECHYSYLITKPTIIKGLTGFDSEMKWYVSMQ